LDFTQVTRYLDDALIFGIKPSLIRIDKILELMGGPQKDSDYIHIVGTNGKTSTTIMLARILRSMGYRAAYHISPHIDSYTERIWVDGSPVTEERFAAAFNTIYPYIEQVNGMDIGGPITQFEIVTALAFLIAREERVDVMVQEAGMGGRWDATNAAYSCVVGLTGISLEHTAILGDTIEEITHEKVEVIKEGARAATISEDSRVLDIFRQKADEVGAEYHLYGRDFKITGRRQSGLLGQEIDIEGVMGEYKDIKLPVIGDYQALNLALSVCLAELYMDIRGQRPDPAKIRDSLRDLSIKGRFEVLAEDPIVVADASHNPEGVEKFCRTVKKYFTGKKKTVVFAVLADKDYPKMLEEVVDMADRLILTSSRNMRSLELERLKEQTAGIIAEREKNNKKVPDIYAKDTVENSLNYALKISDTNDIICITGSITNLEHLGAGKWNEQ